MLEQPSLLPPIRSLARHGRMIFFSVQVWLRTRDPRVDFSLRNFEEAVNCLRGSVFGVERFVGYAAKVDAMASGSKVRNIRPARFETTKLR